jgi:PIN domain nuclease of toxin-antitoxin system
VRLLIDTHFVIYLADDRLDQTSRAHRDIILHETSNVFVSVASLWEVAIKTRIGKLALGNPIGDWPEILENASVKILSVDQGHVLHHIGPEPETNDPFDRLLLGVCAAENLKLVTIDRVLADHPLAWRG